MKIIDNDTYKKALLDKDYKKIMNSASKTYVKKMGYERVKYAKSIALWESLRDFNPDKGMIFTSYLYQKVRWACAKEWKLFKKERQERISTISIDMMDSTQLNIILAKNMHSISDVILSLNKTEQNLVKRRFVDGKTLKEIGEEDGVTLQAIQQRINRIKNKMKF